MIRAASHRTLLGPKILQRVQIRTSGNLHYELCIKSSTPTITSRYFSALSKQDEEEEKKRVAGLSKYEKEIELRNYDKELARLHTLRGINTGELYTFRGKFKALARDYGMGFMAWVSAKTSVGFTFCLDESSLTLYNVFNKYKSIGLFG